MHRFNFIISAASICLVLIAITTPALAEEVETVTDAEARVIWPYKNAHPPVYPGHLADSATAAVCRTEATYLRVHVGEQGEALEVKVEYSDGNAALDQAAMQAARGWRYYPALIRGQASAGWARVPVDFKAADICWQTAPDSAAQPDPASMRRTPPQWPATVKKRPRGDVVLTVKVDSNASLPYAVDIERSSGDEAIDAAAAWAVALWTFQPARLKGVLVRSRLRWTVPYGP